LKRFGVLVAMASLAFVLLTPGQVALAEAGSGRSCMGHEASDISPPGSSEEFPDGAKGLRPELNELFPGVPTGRVVAVIAKLHSGSHAACDAALGVE
jgi:hypothetical protein